MITQTLLNWFAAFVAGFLSALPPLPPEVLLMVTQLHGAASEFAVTAALLGPVVPYAALSAVGAGMLGLLGLWGGLLVLRFVLWGIGR